jgi:hypothetical protein
MITTYLHIPAQLNYISNQVVGSQSGEGMFIDADNEEILYIWPN